ncbi:MAG: AraC family transcriptional regulator [Candidatus Pelethousia sp.]|nr:AraC family transcriptional regulator [Candidatus Pelethousia sp.]
MEWLNRLNAVIVYLEEHLEDEIDLTHMAQIACCSPFHFQRMFSYLAEVPLGEYIRRRKMTRAAADLQNENERIIDIALKYGYDSPTAFNRAFQGVHGIAPSEAQKSGAVLKAYLPISFKIIIKGEVEMDYRIEKKDEFRIVGAKEHYVLNVEENFAQIPAFWQKTVQSGTFSQILGLVNQEPKGILGLTSSMKGKDFDYYIAAPSDMVVPDGLYEYTVPACTWAIFTCIGPMPTAIQVLQKHIISEWLPNSGYEYADAPDIEVYFEGNQQAEDYRCEVWLPVEKK